MMTYLAPPLKVAGVAAAAWMLATVIDPSVFAAALVMVVVAIGGVWRSLIQARAEAAAAGTSCDFACEGTGEG